MAKKGPQHKACWAEFGPLHSVLHVLYTEVLAAPLEELNVCYPGLGFNEHENVRVVLLKSFMPFFFPKNKNLTCLYPVTLMICNRHNKLFSSK